MEIPFIGENRHNGCKAVHYIVREMARANERRSRLAYIEGRRCLERLAGKQTVLSEGGRWKREGYKSLWDQRRQYFLRENRN